MDPSKRTADSERDCSLVTRLLQEAACARDWAAIASIVTTFNEIIAALPADAQEAALERMTDVLADNLEFASSAKARRATSPANEEERQ